MTAARQRDLFSSDSPEEYAAEKEKYAVTGFVRSGSTCSWFSPDPDDKLGRKILKKALYILMRSKPEPDDSCTACGHCVRGCPAKAIEIVNGKAKIDRKKCVRCFCCQEFCPSGAMKVKRSLVARIASK